MSNIPLKSGAIKASEIATDQALATIGTLVGTDALSVLKQIQQLALDSYFKQGIHPFSLGKIKWNGTQILFNEDARANDIYFRVLQTESDTLRTIDIVLKGTTGANTATTFNNIALANGDLAYVEIDRATLLAAPGGVLIVENQPGGSLVNGKTLKKINLTSTTGMAKITSLLSGGGTSLFIPVAFRYDWTDGSTNFQDLMWAIAGERWEIDTSTMLGSSVAKSSGGAILNFIETSGVSWDAEVGIVNMNVYNNASAVPTTGTGGVINPNFVFNTTTVASEVLSGKASFVINKTANGSMQGHGISFDVKIDAGYRARQVYFKSIFNKISGTLADGDFKVFIIANPLGTPQLITPQQNSFAAIMGDMSAGFYPLLNVDTYRVCIHLTSTQSGQFRFAIDDLKISPIYYVTADAFGAVQPAGAIAAFGGGVDPEGWMLCDGRSLLRSAYPELFGQIGTSFGTSSGTTFNIPDFRGLFLRGRDGGIARDADRAARTALNPGGATGDNVGSYQADEIVNHAHNYTFTSVAGGGREGGGMGTITGASYNNAGTSGTGGSETRPKNIGVNYIIKLYSDKKSTVLANNRVEYASNSNASAATTDATAFYNGIQGSAIPSLVQGTGATRTVAFVTQIQPADTLKLQSDYGSGGKYWADLMGTYPTVSYPAITIMGAISTGSAIINGIYNLSGIVEGMSVTGADIPVGTTILSINRTTGDVTMSQNATATSTGQLIALSAMSFGVSMAPSVSVSTQAIVNFGAGGATPTLTWSAVNAAGWRFRVVKSSNDMAMEVITKDNPGVVKLFAGASIMIPAGWLECNGQSLLRTAYPDLFAAIGTTYGAASAATFNVPDTRGMFIRGDVGFSSIAVPASSVSGQNIIVAGHPFQQNGFEVRLSGTLPGVVAINTSYYVIIVDANTIRLASTRANAISGIAITMTGTNTGVMQINEWVDPDYDSRQKGTIGAANLIQPDAFASHNHNFVMPAGTGGPSGVNTSGSYTQSGATLPTQFTGGAETRPKNLIMKYIIKA